MARRTKAEREHAVAVEAAVVDQMYRGIEHNAKDWRRDHFGASGAGHKCERYLWLKFRWALNPKHDGKQLRLFGRGDREEPALVENLCDAGMTVQEVDTETEEQFRVRWGHLGGSCDGKILGVPGLPDDEEVLAEFKTSNRKSFDYLVSKKVRSAKKEHWVQMQLYMDGLGLKHAIYLVVCKETDRIYCELVDYDEDQAKAYKARAQKIITAEAPPDKLDKDQIPCVYVSKDGTRWPCDFFELCHGKAMPERNCRTCVSSTPIVVTGEPLWACSLDQATVAPDIQRTGCAEQCSIPPIVNAQVTDVKGRQVFYQFEDGSKVNEPLLASVADPDPEC